MIIVCLFCIFMRRFKNRICFIYSFLVGISSCQTAKDDISSRCVNRSTYRTSNFPALTLTFCAYPEPKYRPAPLINALLSNKCSSVYCTFFFQSNSKSFSQISHLTRSLFAEKQCCPEYSSIPVCRSEAPQINVQHFVQLIHRPSQDFEVYCQAPRVFPFSLKDPNLPSLLHWI